MIRPRRSALYMPGSNARAQDKARTLPCDVVMFDLEDAVAPDAKTQARTIVSQTVEEGGFGRRELVIRVNGLDTAWGAEDVREMARLPVQALLFPKVESVAECAAIDAAVAAAGGADKEIWVMIETPIGVMNALSIAAHDSVKTLVMGTSDLVKELRARHTRSRDNISYGLQSCVLAARAAGVDILDGVHLAFKDQEAFAEACEQARDMGFDGKTLIHPTQIEQANRSFGVDEAAVAHARELLTAWEAARAAGQGVATLNGSLIENLHVEEAERVLAVARAIEEVNP